MAHRDLPVFERTEQEFRSPGEPLSDEGTGLLVKLQLLWENRHQLFRLAFCGFVVFAVIALLIPSKYDSVVRLMPPERDTSNASMLASLVTSKGGDSLGSFAGDLLGAKTSGALFIGILRSRTVEDALVSKFDLCKLYWVRRREDARRVLEERTSILEDRKSGIITIAVRDHSPERAQAMAQAYVDQLNIAVAALSTSSARREREFLETRLSAVKQDLDQAARDFSQFASKNTTIDITEQGKAMVDAAARLQGELIAAEAQKQGLEQMYTTSNARVRSAQANIDELRRQLNKLGGADVATGSSGSETSLYPSIRQLPVLGVKYADLYRRTKIEEAVFETLTKQYELAKVQEAKEIPTVKVLDPPDYPEKKAVPHRTYIALFGLILFVAAGCIWMLFWRQTDDQDPRKMFLKEIWAGMRHDWATVRRRFGLPSAMRRSR